MEWTGEVGRRSFTVKMDGAANRFVILLGGRRAGFFLVDPATQEIRVEGRFSNIAESDGVIVAVARAFLRSRGTP
jgi:hypothetical protein